MINLQDITFVIPYFKDSQDRYDNIQLVIKYLRKHFDTKIIVYEVGETETIEDKSNIDSYIFSPIADHKIIHRTKMINEMVKQVTTPYFCNYDTDIILSVNQYVKSLELLKQGQDVVYPYEKFMRIERKDFNDFSETLNISSLKNLQDHGVSVGGCIFFNRTSFIRGGMENEYFISYGPEDYEREFRFKTLGFAVSRLWGTNLYHLNHFVGPNSSGSNPYFNFNNDQYNRVKNMDAELLRKYIATWDWL